MKKRILILGGKSAVASELLALIGGEDVFLPDRSEADLTRQEEVINLFQRVRPDEVYHLAARTAAPQDHRNDPWRLFRDNLLMQVNVFDACVKFSVSKIVWFSSDSALPYYSDYREVSEVDLFSNPVKKDMESYAMAKLAGIRMCEDAARERDISAVSILPCNIYGRVKKGLMYDMCKDIFIAKLEGKSAVTMWGGWT